MNENVKKLAGISQDIKFAQKLGQFPETETMNQALQIYYFKRSENLPQLKTFAQWKSEGKSVKKGEKGFAFWSAPKQGSKQEVKETGDVENHEYKFWNICYLFADWQVSEIEQKK